jgi:uncharacterized protein with FMN-binding domain
VRRAIFGITGLVVSTTLLVVLKGGPATTPTAQSVPVGPAGGSTAPTASGAPPEPTPEPGAGSVAPSGSVGPGRSVAPSGSPSHTRAPGSKPPTKAPTSGSTTTKAPPPSGPRKIDGAVIAVADFGLVQVQITVSGAKITNVTALEMPRESATTSRKSDQVDKVYSGPGGAAVAAANQGRLPDTVSGATQTCNGYRQSLQAALDRA